jgi:hypothetical protein
VVRYKNTLPQRRMENIMAGVKLCLECHKKLGACDCIKPEFAYTITDKYHPDLKIKNSANAWWIDRGKVERLISAFKIDASIGEACVYAGITYDQYKYFMIVHPEFSIIKELCSDLPTLQARQEVVKGIANDKEFAMKYLERKRKKEFGTSNTILGDPENPIVVATDQIHEKIKSIVGE